jgi:hypothetical protein
MYENKKEPLASKEVFYGRVYRNLLYTITFLSLCLTFGVLGYHYTAHLAWIDSIHNASMILSGMGPVVVIEGTVGKLFSSFYALFSGVAFITNVAILIAPIAHRFFHRLHLEEN